LDLCYFGRVVKISLIPGMVLGGTYKIVRFIGSGGTGEVYEVEHIRVHRRYAAKVLLGKIASNPEAQKRFKREADVISKLNHPNIVQIVDFNQAEDGTLYLVMELLDGATLANEIKGCTRLPLHRVVPLVRQIASGLMALHEEGVFHRDIKPANLILVHLLGDEETTVKILDFGLSKVLGEDAETTRTGAILGTPLYMAPEQAMGRKDIPIDRRTDVYSLAAVTYTMINGRPSFSGSSFAEVILQVTQEPPLPFEPDLHLPEVEEVVRRGMAKGKDDRYPTALDFYQALAKAAALTSPAEPVDKTPPSPPESQRVSTHGAPFPDTMDETTNPLLESASPSIPTPNPEPPRPRSPGGLARRLLIAGLAMSTVAVLAFAYLPKRGVDPLQSSSAPVLSETSRPLPVDAVSDAPLDGSAVDAGTDSSSVDTLSNSPTRSPRARPGKGRTAPKIAAPPDPNLPPPIFDPEIAQRTFQNRDQ
jgi:eukaryotic-like serine/threonine-protein kinase